MSDKTVAIAPIFDTDDYKEQREIFLNDKNDGIRQVKIPGGYTLYDYVRTFPQHKYATQVQSREGQKEAVVPDAVERLAQLNYLDDLRNNPELLEQFYEKGIITPDTFNDLFDEELYDEFKSFAAKEQARPSKEYNKVPWSSILEKDRLERIEEEGYEGAGFLPLPERTTQGVPSPLGQRQIPRKDEFYEASRKLQHELTEEEKYKISQRGGNPETYFLENIDIPLNMTISDILSMDIRTKTEMENIVRLADPNAEVTPINPKDLSEGWLVWSPLYSVTEENPEGEWVPFTPVSLFSGDDLEPAYRAINKEVWKLAPDLILAGGGALKTTNLAKKHKQFRSAENVSRIKQGLPVQPRSRSEKLVDYLMTSTLVSGGAAFGEGLSTALKGSAAKMLGYKPELTFERVLEDAGTITAIAFMGDELGAGLLKLMHFMFTRGKSDLPDTALNEYIARAQRVREQNEAEIERIKNLEGSAEKFGTVIDMGYVSKVTQGPNETDRAYRAKVLEEWIELSGADLGDTFKRYRETVGELTKSDIIRAIEHNVTQLDSGGNAGVTAIAEIYANRGDFLDKYYNSIIDDLETKRLLDGVGLGKKEINQLYDEIKQQSLGRQITEEERKRAEAFAESDLNQFDSIFQEMPTRRQAAEEIGERVETPVSTALFPDSKNALFVERDNQVNEAKRSISDILDRPEFNAVGQYSQATVKTGQFISKPLEALIDADKRGDAIFATLDEAEAAETIRRMLPNREEEGISIVDLLAKPFKFQQPFTVAQLVNTRENLKSVFNNHPNQKLKELGQELIRGFDKAIAAGMNKIYQIQTKEKALNYDTVLDIVGGDLQAEILRLDELKKQVSGRYIRSLVDKSPEEIGQFVLNSPSSSVEELVTFLTSTAAIKEADGPTTIDGLKKLEAIKTLVLEEIKDRVENPNKAKEAANFKKLLKAREFQLEALFPEQIVDFKNFANFQETAGKAIKNSLIAQTKLEKELEKVGAVSITDILDSYFSGGPMSRKSGGFEFSTREKALERLSELADQNPNLRKAMIGYFSDYLKGMKSLEYRDFAADQARDRELSGSEFILKAGGPESTFYLNRLSDFVMAFESENELARQLGFIVGKDNAQQHAKLLRQFKMDMKRTAKQTRYTDLDKKGFERRSPHRTLFQVVKDFIAGPLNPRMYKTNSLLDYLSGVNLDHLGTIVADPDKLEQLYDLKNKRLNYWGVTKTLGAIATGRYKEGEGAFSEAGETPAETFQRTFREEMSEDTEDRLLILESVIN